MPELGNHVSGILGSVHSEGLEDHYKRLCEIVAKFSR